MTWRFIHIPKCGGMSFRKAYADCERELLPTHDPGVTLPECRTVAVMRHPLDRLVSAYCHHFGGPDGMEQWVDSGRWLETPSLAVCKHDRRRTMATCSPQVAWLRPDTVVIDFDRYQEGLDQWAEMAGFPQRQLERRNASQRGGADWRTHLRADQIQELTDFYSADFERRRAGMLPS